MAERIKMGLIKVDIDDDFGCFSDNSKLEEEVGNLLMSEKDLEIYLLGQDLSKYQKSRFIGNRGILYAKKFM